MNMIRYWLYNTLLLLAAPVCALYLLLSNRNRRLLRRFWPALPSMPDTPIWIHACSVGEINATRGLVQTLRHYIPDTPVLLSVSTLSAYKLAISSSMEVTTVFAPFDLLWSVRGFIKKAKPRILVIIETELWPNLIRESNRNGIPVVIVNARLSPKRFPRYMRYRGVLPPVYDHLRFVAAQDDIYAERFRMLGILPEKIAVTGNMKNDAELTEICSEERDMVRRENGFSKNDDLVIFGSTRPGDEQLAASCWRQLKNEFPSLGVIIAPRHIQRIEEALLPFMDEQISKRTAIKKGIHNWHARIFYLDTLGELTRFYGLSTIAVIGGSFFPGVEGHNPLESAALGVPTVFGPYMGNFSEAATMLLNAEGAFQIKNPDELLPLIRTLLLDPVLRERVARKGRKAVLNSRGAVERNKEIILRYIQ